MDTWVIEVLATVGAASILGWIVWVCIMMGEVSDLKKRFERMQETYRRDMNGVSADMTLLEQQILNRKNKK